LNKLKKVTLSLAVAGALLSTAMAQAAHDLILRQETSCWSTAPFRTMSWTRSFPCSRQRLHVTAVQNPLTSLGDDVSATTRAIDAQNGR